MPTRRKKTINDKLHIMYIQQRGYYYNSFVNVSHLTPTTQQRNILQLGLHQPYISNKWNVNDAKALFERIYRSICLTSDGSKINGDVKAELIHHFCSYRNLCKQMLPKYTAQFKCLETLKKDPSICILPMDKGRGTVIMNKMSYNEKLSTIVDDHTKFSCLQWDINPSNHPLIIFEDKVQRAVRSTMKHIVEKYVYNKVYPSGTSCGKLYGMAKVHKEGIPLRPVVSMVNTPTYHLAKYLDDVIKPYCPKAYNVESSYEFVSKLKHYMCDNNSDSHLVSFDVASLFTNIPLNETIDIITSYIYDNSGDSCCPFTKSQLTKLLRLATEGIFSFNNHIYRQIDGVAMGNPLAPTMADFFMGHLEKSLFENSQEFFPSFYCRYVDDTFCVFRHPTHSDYFLNHLNSLHPNLTFTSEKSYQNSLPFLDVKVTVSDSDVVYTVYRKPTFTGQLLNYKALVPKIWKKNTVTSMVYRAFRLTSSWKLFHEEILKIKDVLIYNNYPKWWLDSAVKLFLRDYHKNHHVPVADKETSNYTVIKLQYLGKPSVKLKKDINRILRALGNKRIKVCFYMRRLSTFFTNKDRSHDLLKASVVYKYTCSEDPDIFYVGETTRQLIRRAQQHYTDPNSGIYRHIQFCNTCNQNNFYQNFKILASATDECDLEIKEALYIKDLTPSLNIQQVSGKRTTALQLF